MKKFAHLAILGLSLIAGSAIADTQPTPNTGVEVINTSSTLVIGHIYDSKGLLIGAVYAPANSGGNEEPAKTFTKQLYVGITVASSSGGVDNLYTSSCFAAHTFQTFVYSTNPINNNFNSTKPPVCSE